MGAGRSKGLLTLGGRPLLLWAVAAMIESGQVGMLAVVARAEELDVAAETMACCPFPVAVVPGGAERADSVRAGLEWLAAWDGWRPGIRHLAAIHDAGRPLLTVDLWQRVITAALRDGAAIPGLPMVDTLKRADADGLVTETVSREHLWRIQTPQVFGFEELLAAHRAARLSGQQATDDAQVWEAAGRPVRIVPGDADNIKITTQADLRLAEAILRQGGEEAAGRTGL